MKTVVTAIAGCALIAGFSSCSMLNKNSSASYNKDALPVENYVGSTGVKNVNQVLLSMATVTNVPTSSFGPSGTNVSIATQYQTISPFVSPDGSVPSINPAMLLSITGLAGQVCQAFASQEASKLNVLANTGISFSGSGTTWSSQFTSSATVSTNVINALSTQFWGRAPTSAELSILLGAVQAAAGEVPGTGSAGVQNVLIVPCTIMLASPAFLTG